MKGIFGIWVALGLGIAGAFCNWFYLASEAKNFEAIEFLAVGDSPINPGDRFTESSFVRVPVKRLNVGYLEKSGVKYSELKSVVGLKAPYSLQPHQILLHQDLQQPPPPDVKSNLGADEVLMWLPLDTRVVVPSLLKAGDEVSFVIPNLPKGPTPVGDPGEPAAERHRVIGPYRILAMGNRLGSSDKLRAVGGGAMQENMMAVAVGLKDKKLDAAGRELSEVLATTNFQNVQVLPHPDKKR